MFKKNKDSDKYIANNFTFLIFLLTLVAVFFLSNKPKYYTKKK
jgi:hypothetical protein